MPTFYAYDPKTLYYTGEVTADACPRHASAEKPGLAEGWKAYMDPQFKLWHVVRDISNMSLAEAKASVQEAAYASFQRDGSSYSRQERKSWPMQREEVRIYRDTGAVGPFLEALSQDEESVEALVRKIEAKIHARDTRVAKRVAALARVRNRIDAATTVEELPDIVELMQESGCFN